MFWVVRDMTTETSGETGSSNDVRVSRNWLVIGLVVFVIFVAAVAGLSFSQGQSVGRDEPKNFYFQGWEVRSEGPGATAYPMTNYVQVDQRRVTRGTWECLAGRRYVGLPTTTYSGISSGAGVTVQASRPDLEACGGFAS